jgi:hypothetical protein
MTTSHILTSSSRKHAITKKWSLSCAKCFQEIQIGQELVRKGRNVRTRFYHKECFESLFIELDEDENEEEKA